MAETTVADALELLALPVEMRERLTSLVRDAYFAGFDDAKECAESDRRMNMSWLNVSAYRISGAGLWLTAECLPLLGVDVGCDIDPIYSPSNSTVSVVAGAPRREPAP